MGVSINDLSSIDTVVGSDQMVLWDTSGGVSRKAALSALATYIQSTFTSSTFRSAFTTQRATPINGATVAVTDGSDSIHLLLTPAGTLAGMTITMPALANCTDKQEVLITSTQTITTLVISGNGSGMFGEPSTLVIGNGGFAKMKFDASTSNWIRVG